jgi:hypothetical protein
MWTRRICPALIFFVSLILFLCTLAPTVTFVDSGELIVTARNLGVAHPPGFPLYLLVTHLATLLPLGNVAQRAHFVSALCAALAVLLLYFMITEAIFAWQSRTVKKIPGRANVREKQATLPDRFMFVPGLVSGCLAVFSRTLWSYATVAEVYTLNALLILLVFLLVLRWRNGSLNLEEVAGRSAKTNRNKHQYSEDSIRIGESRRYYLLYLAAFVFGLALGVHHVTVALTLPAIAWLVYKTEGMSFFKGRRLLAAALAFLIGVAVYAYLPLAAARSPVLNWGNPDNLSRFWTHVTGRQYQSNISFSSDQIQRQVSSFVGLLFREFGWPWFPAGLLLCGIGFWWLYHKDKILMVFFLLVIGFNLLFALGYEIAEDKDAYYLPIFLAVALAAGFGVHALLAAVSQRRIQLVAGIALLVPFMSLAANLRINNRRSYFVAEDYVNNILNAVSPNGLLLTGDWQVASPLLYFQEIDKLRPDAVCIDVLLLKRSWYYGYLESKYPALMQKSRSGVGLFMEDLLQWEKDPGAYQRDPQLNRRIDARFCAMIEALARNHFPAGPVYATEDVVLNSDVEGRTLAQSLTASYQIVPQGLVFQLFADRGSHQTELPELRIRGLSDGSPAIREDPGDSSKSHPGLCDHACELWSRFCGAGRRQVGDASLSQGLGYRFIVGDCSKPSACRFDFSMIRPQFPSRCFHLNRSSPAHLPESPTRPLYLFQNC